MDKQTRELVQAIHNCSTRAVLVTAGAGTQALSDLLGVAGATRTLLEALVPYSEASFNEFLGRPPKKYVSAKTARLLAGRAYTRARWLESKDASLVGLACTATIVTDRPKRGEHRAYVATWQPAQLVYHGLHLQKGARDRVSEEGLVSRVILNALAQACGVDALLPTLLLSSERLEMKMFDFAAAAGRLDRREIDFFAVNAHGRIRTTGVCPQVLLCGAFNPLHKGHLALAKTAASVLNKPVAFELSAVNVDKPTLSVETVLDRLAQFAGRWPVYVTNAPTYVEKARLFPGATFIVGYDTAVRVLHPRYYDNSWEHVTAALDKIRACGCRFLVAGRTNESGVFNPPEALSIPDSWRDLFELVPLKQFRRDISSTELRAKGEKGSR